MNKDNEFILTTPVLLIGFNRPDTIKEVFNRIRVAKPEKLYVAIDGARANQKGEQKLVEQVKKIVQMIDWPCQYYYRFNDVNKGAEVTVSSAISWVFEQEEYAIILEDDIVAPLSFFKFLQEMLVKYKNDDRIWSVTGVNFTPLDLPNNIDYFFAKYGHTWGWGTWKRVWDKFNLNTEVLDEHLKKNFLKEITNSPAERKYYYNKFKKIKKKGIGNSTWDNIASYMHRTNKLLYIVPRVNLSSNIGIEGLHARGKTENHFRQVDETFEVIRHPDKVECNVEFDMHYFKTYLSKKKPLYKRIIRKIHSFIKVIKRI